MEMRFAIVIEAEALSARLLASVASPLAEQVEAETRSRDMKRKDWEILAFGKLDFGSA